VSNASTVRRQIAGTQQLTLAPLLGTIIGTTQTSFQLNNNGLTLSGGGVIPLSAGVTGLYAGTGQVLVVRAAGQIAGATATTTNLALELFEVPASVIAAGLTSQSFTGFNEVGATGAAEIHESAGSFRVVAHLQLDASGNLEGIFEAYINGAAIVSAAAITPITGLVGEADLNFVLAATLTGAESGVVLTLDEFAIDLE
jgi:hypothetical protein